VKTPNISTSGSAVASVTAKSSQKRHRAAISGGKAHSGAGSGGTNQTALKASGGATGDEPKLPRSKKSRHAASTVAAATIQVRAMHNE
jgi:hypothetical protein